MFDINETELNTNILTFSKRQMEVDDQMIPYKQVSQTATTYWEKLTKKGRGFKFDKDKPLLQYIDEAMTEEYGNDKSQWTRPKLRRIKYVIESMILNKMDDE